MVSNSSEVTQALRFKGPVGKLLKPWLKLFQWIEIILPFAKHGA